MRTGWVFAAALVPVALGGLGACVGGPRGESDGPVQAVRALVEALDAGNGERACSLLAPATRHQVEQSAKQTCGPALLAEDLPRSSAVIATEVFGDRALVRTHNDVLFLARAAGTWVVTAAGCTPRGGRPYDCDVEGS